MSTPTGATSLRRKYLIWGLLAASALAILVWLGWAAKATEQLANREPLQCAIPAPATGSPRTGMVWVPGGELELGDTVYPEESPIRKVKLSGFWIDRTEVTNNDFAAFVAATAYKTVAERVVDPLLHPELPPEMRLPGAVVFINPNSLSGKGSPTQWWRYVPGANWRHPGGPDTDIEGRGAFPVVTVTIEDAQAYARWKGAVLPSEAQWEWAARGASNTRINEHAQPKAANTWQGLFPVAYSGEDGFVGLAPAGCYTPNALGLFDMIGNAWELTRDAYTASHDVLASEALPTPEQARSKPLVKTSSQAAAPVAQHVIKGGSFLCAPNYCMRYRAGSRQGQEDDLAVSHVGFRTVLMAPGP